VASNWGKNKHADWYLNLKKTPQASLEIKGRLIPLLARQALGDEYAALWKFATGRHPPYLDYQEMTSRPIPLMLFEPVN
jgi:deazaflavin-dependent oxidoreductase (nitroreductase family)